MSPAPHRIVGIDLGGGKGRTTALAIIEPRDEAATVVALHPRPASAPLYDDVLIPLLRAEPEGTLLCVDAPLSLPPCLTCREPVCPGQAACVDPQVVTMRRLAAAGAAARGERLDDRRGKPAVTPYTQRPAEVYLTEVRGIAARETLGQGTGPLTARAQHLLRALGDRFHVGRDVIEVHPRATLQALGIRHAFKRHLRERERRAEILEWLSPGLRFGPGVWRESCVQSDHAFEATLAAYTGFLARREGWTLPPEAAAAGEAGWIWVPPAPEGAALAAATASAAPVLDAEG